MRQLDSTGQSGSNYSGVLLVIKLTALLSPYYIGGIERLGAFAMHHQLRAKGEDQESSYQKLMATSPIPGITRLSYFFIAPSSVSRETE